MFINNGTARCATPQSAAWRFGLRTQRGIRRAGENASGEGLCAGA
ncbi:hypothetical protein [Pandoraea faecigallinarum]|nr:hypothetical protein [Pandoraea faecigallinarum]